ncbi:hypothetical protein AB0G35_09470 [Streptomyces sp. NPDC021749]|uniref:hypothetical protein n=1 Tax=Streptomyces sp. NPDC021749 TaxID=3154905 RepID=UPI0033EA0F63
MQGIVEYLNTDVEVSAIEVEETEGTIFSDQAPVLATPAALTVAAFASGFAVGRTIG